MAGLRSIRVCPICGESRSMDIRSETCSNACGRKLMVQRQKARDLKNPGLGGLEKQILGALKAGPLSIKDLSTRLDRSRETVLAAVESLRSKGYTLDLGEEEAKVSEVAPGAEEPLILHPRANFTHSPRVFGALGDSHLGSKHERLDVLNALYDLYQEEGVKEVFHTGNWIEGESRKNFHDIKVFGMDAQIDYWIDKYPQREGITTHFIAGDDHEGWYQQREAVEIGRYAMLRAKASGRQDLNYLGYLEADIVFTASEGERWMKIMHPGGGSAYALSYAPQRLAESFQGGEKPAIVLIGHYHKFDVCYPREIWCIQTGCQVDQSIFMRKMKIQAHVGGCLVWMNQAPDGQINRLKVEFVPFYDRGFYQNQRKF